MANILNSRNLLDNPAEIGNGAGANTPFAAPAALFRRPLPVPGDGGDFGDPSLGTGFTPAPSPVTIRPIGGGGGVTLPAVTFLSPQPGAVYNPGDTLPILWQVSSPVTQQILSLKQVGGPGVIQLGAFGAQTGSLQYYYPIPQGFPFASAAAELDVYTASGGPFQVFSGAFTVRTQPVTGGSPTAFTSPHGGEVWSCNQVQSVSWSYSGSATVQHFEIAISLGGGPYQTLNSYISGGDRTYYLFPPFVYNNTQATLRLRTVLANGTIAPDAFSNSFTLGNF